MPSNFIKKQIKLYKTFDKCFCCSLQEDVYFNAGGLNHILYYRRRPRKHSEKHYRASLVKYIKGVIENSKVAIREIKSENPLVITWSLEYKIVDCDSFEHIVKVILSKKGNGKIYFLSVMSNKTKKSKP
ncbi:hypothetical protein ACFLY7_01515 [Patescibacteria group bacterium]